MNSSRKSTLSLRQPGKSKAASKARRRFNTLVKDLETQRGRLAAWHDALPRMRARASTELMPLEEQCHLGLRRVIMLFDRAYEHTSFGKTEREKLSCLICELILDLSELIDDDELDALYDKHDPDDDDDPNFAAFEEVVDQMFDDDAVDGDDDAAHTTRKPTAKETRRASEEKRLQQSVRDIFRKLASSAHPDRETDPAERERKTALMQRVNAAYAKDDLLGLLELQFEVEQIDQAALETLGDDRIRQYNKVLGRQVEEVRHEIAALEQWLIYDLHLLSRKRITPALLDDAFVAEKAYLENTLRTIESDIRKLQDFKLIKEFLRDYTMPEYFDEQF